MKKRKIFLRTIKQTETLIFDKNNTLISLNIFDYLQESRKGTSWDEKYPTAKKQESHNFQCEVAVMRESIKIVEAVVNEKLEIPKKFRL
ncbi:351_t:CDS:2 [Dentiscutata erythropus]|uniref:351_t:CDS:1 n=1 Tax=Dentiscutata erythropus TaxID=1348616 RepID=A0A9N9C573_9GLOM|nr:351_t:CDS:2 [Dentiscutata erythropus]